MPHKPSITRQSHLTHMQNSGRSLCPCGHKFQLGEIRVVKCDKNGVPGGCGKARFRPRCAECGVRTGMITQSQVDECRRTLGRVQKK